MVSFEFEFLADAGAMMLTIWSCSRELGGKALTIISNRQSKGIGQTLDSDTNLAGIGMLDNVVKTFLDHSIQRDRILFSKQIIERNKFRQIGSGL